MVEREQKTKEADARSPTLNASCSTSKHVYGNLVYSELASQARMLVDEGKQGCNDYNVCCKGNDFLVIREISNEIFLFFFLSALLSHLDTSFYSFLFAVFFCRLTKFPFFYNNTPRPSNPKKTSILSFRLSEIFNYLSNFFLEFLRNFPHVLGLLFLVSQIFSLLFATYLRANLYLCAQLLW